jgi:hypothetical protein
MEKQNTFLKSYMHQVWPKFWFLSYKLQMPSRPLPLPLTIVPFKINAIKLLQFVKKKAIYTN